MRGKIARGSGGSAALERERRELVDECPGTLRHVAVWCGARHGPQDPDRVDSMPELELPGRQYFTTVLARHHLVRPLARP
jgi:hypothetical protein